MSGNLPKHIAIIMDGNGRWANKHGLPRAKGHREGVKALRLIVEHCVRSKINTLTAYAFSSENWGRPGKEVNFLLDLLMSSLKEEVDSLDRNNVKLQFIGERAAFSRKLQDTISSSETRTAENTGLNLVIAANFGGRWDITHAAKQIAARAAAGELTMKEIDESLLDSFTSLAALPVLDLFIRTGGEQRISNFLLWQLAYTELYFTDELWPDFGPRSLDMALEWFAGRQRRFGKTSEQVRRAREG